MIIIPELETVVIQPPRTGSTSLRVAIKDRWAKSFSPYHHMEQDGIPKGYETFRLVGMMRHPMDRLVSMYSYMRSYENPHTDQNWIARMRKDSDRSFSDWLLDSEEVFTDAYIGGKFNPLYSVMQIIPAVDKPQVNFFDPDHAEVLWLENVDKINDRFDITLPLINRSVRSDEKPRLSAEAIEKFNSIHQYDIGMYTKEFKRDIL